jgi:hypothetical protein
MDLLHLRGPRIRSASSGFLSHPAQPLKQLRLTNWAPFWCVLLLKESLASKTMQVPWFG